MLCLAYICICISLVGRMMEDNNQCRQLARQVNQGKPLKGKQETGLFFFPSYRRSSVCESRFYLFFYIYFYGPRFLREGEKPPVVFPIRKKIPSLSLFLKSNPENWRKLISLQLGFLLLHLHRLHPSASPPFHHQYTRYMQVHNTECGRVCLYTQGMVGLGQDTQDHHRSHPTYGYMVHNTCE